jgi:hypothetical protein
LFTDPRHCSIHDPTHSTCFLDPNAQDGFYEGSWWSYLKKRCNRLILTPLSGSPILVRFLITLRVQYVAEICTRLISIPKYVFRLSPCHEYWL